MLVECAKEGYTRIVSDDPVRPFLFEDNAVRFDGYFKVYADVDPKADVKNPPREAVRAVICVVISPWLIESEHMLQRLASGEFEPAKDSLAESIFTATGTHNMPTIITPYSLWTYKKGAGRKLLNELLDHVSLTVEGNPLVITMSPPTQVAMKFHLSNGAVLLALNEGTINYQYQLPKVGTH